MRRRHHARAFDPQHAACPLSARTMFSLNLLQFVKAALFLATGYFSGRALVRPAPAPAPFAGFNNADLDTLVGQPVDFILDAVLGPGHNALTGPPPRRNAPLRRTDSTVDVCEDGGNGQWYSLVHRRMQPYPFYRTAKDIRDSRRRQAREAQARAAAAAAYAANPPVAVGPLYAGVYTPPIGRDIIANAPPGTYPPPVIPHFPVFNTAVPNTPPATGRRFASPSSLETNPPSTTRYSLNSKRKRQAEDEVNGEDEAEAHLSEKAKGKRRRIETDSGAGSAANEATGGSVSADEQPVAGPSRAAGSHEQTVQPSSSGATGASESITTTAAAGPSEMTVDDYEPSGSSSSSTAAPAKARRTTRKAAAALVSLSSPRFSLGLTRLKTASTSTGPTRTLRSSTRNAPYPSASAAAASTSTAAVAVASSSAASPRRSTRSRKGKGKATEADNMDLDES
ncbi:hypothetical protein EXIGLDRAFT_470623 [Exidia glandulosa HHB12029]|uniref:Uncharacterized protein n=1 Tax=Exidia glandulosa HHB12029 TaxID=1314781 RepID=A0A165JZI9_EXIGL|nr:hypothetical protein EXIGLDRAFT_470623 [Exidia glandulosa HHB12029]